MPEVEILQDTHLLAERAAGLFLQLASETLQTSARFLVAMAGGSTPMLLYSLLTGVNVDWRSIHFFWSDERCVPPDHPNSNYRKAYEALLSRVPIPPDNIHRILGELQAERAALTYEENLRSMFGNWFPRFDLILLGLGEDGHTASLFPGCPAIQEMKRYAVAVRHTKPPRPCVDRVTLTPPVLNSAVNIFFLVSGMEKAEALAQVLKGSYLPDLYPAQVVQPKDGTLHWLVDKAAAAKIL